MDNDIVLVNVRKIYVDDLTLAGLKARGLVEAYKNIVNNVAASPDFIMSIGRGILDWKQQEWEPHTKYVFESQGGVMKWAPNRGHYAIWKFEKYKTDKILHLTGNLETSYTGSWQYKETGNEIVISTEIPDYAQYHQTGTPPPNWRGNLPFLKRVFHYITSDLILNAGRRVGRKVFKLIIRKIKETQLDW